MAIGVAILSTNRPNCLKRLIESIEKYTKDLNTIDLFVSDDSCSEGDFKEIDDYIFSKPYINFSHIGETVGVAYNSNNCLHYLKDHEFNLVLNNDVEILKYGWETFYFDMMKKTGLHHFCYRQNGLWGAGTNLRPEVISKINGVQIKTIFDFPQGAVLAYDALAFQTVGYFDAKSFRGYGKSHWDWSFRISNSKIQPEGIHDVIGAEKYFKIHAEESCTPESVRRDQYRKNTEIYNKIKIKQNRIFIPYVKYSTVG